MVRPSIHRSSIIALYGRGVKAQAISQRLGIHRSVVYKTIKWYKTLGTENDRPRPGRPRTVATKSNIKKVRDKVRRNPARSVRRFSKEMGISRSSMMRIVKDYLKLKAYKRNKCHFLTEDAKKKRKDRCQKLLRRIQGGLHRLIVFTDEKVFTVEQAFNKQNDRVYARSQPNCPVERRSHPKSVMVFAGITADGKTPLIFVPQGIKINSSNYLAILKEEFYRWAQKHSGSRHFVFQQDGAPSHKAAVVQDWCRQNFPGFISFGEWPPNSPDLNPMDYSVWSVLEAKSCSKPHQTVESLKQDLQKAWDELSSDYLRATVDAFPEGLKSCIAANGGTFEK
ncbi:hypothetical protein Y032_0655g1201 [Ancylostoma ceylanicum]|uniref:Tc1-like transposase DDE domain-containing protein n=1 Tax=Ancylostoma ceylanicum TaxID=53326 RepID=A0A016WKB6_9BILA|nr:hypothetical protein Y032_0655g1201 [Ancylostoma ceylanicum]